MALVVLNVYDAFTTLCIIHRGGEELNPVMGFLLAVSPYAFLAYKVVLVGCITVGLLANWRIPAARMGLVLLVAVYVLVAAWNTMGFYATL